MTENENLIMTRMASNFIPFESVLPLLADSNSSTFAADNIKTTRE